MVSTLASSSRFSFKARRWSRTISLSITGQNKLKMAFTSIMSRMISACRGFRGIPSSRSVSASGLNRPVAASPSMDCFQS